MKNSTLNSPSDTSNVHLELLNTIAQKLTEAFGDTIISYQLDYDIPTFTIKKDSLIAVLEYLKNESSLGFTFLTTLCGIHLPENKGSEMAVMYQLQNMQQNWRVRIKIFMSINDLKVPTLTTLWPAANWMERQEYDFFGIQFEGHPDLRRILNMDEMNYHPMRKEYALEDGSRDDKNDKLFGR